MNRKTPFFALLGCSFALIALPAFTRADDSAKSAAKTGTASSAPAASAPAASPASAPAAALLWPSTLAPVHKMKAKGVPNFGKLNDHIWRSGQPTAEGYASLKEMGLKTIVNLRKEDPGEKDRLPEGIKYVYIPIQDETAPTPEQAQQFLDVASDPNNWPLLVHCHGGEGRAGVMSALVRFDFDGWDHGKIMKEVDTFRTAHLGFIKIKMAGCQQDFLKKWESDHKAGEYAAKFAKADIPAGK